MEDGGWSKVRWISRESQHSIQDVSLDLGFENDYFSNFILHKPNLNI